MKRIIYILVLMFAAGSLPAQMKVLYGIKNGGVESVSDSIVLYASKDMVRISRPSLNKESQYIDRKNSETIQLLNSGDGVYSVFKKKYEVKFTEPEETAELNGYQCFKRTLNIRSNKVEVWYTDMSENYGAPLLYLAEIPGLVLKVVRNGNYEIYAKDISFSDVYAVNAALPEGRLKEVNEAEFQRMLIESRYSTQEVFTNEVLNFNNDLKSDFSKEIIKAGKGSVALRKIRIPELTENTIVIAEVTVRSNGDAYDRTGSLFAVPLSGKKNILEAFEKGVTEMQNLKDSRKGILRTEEYDTPLELMRFITSFGAGYFNKDMKIEGMQWKDSIVYRLEVTEVLKGIGGNNEAYIGAFIGNWDKGGHVISVRFKYFEEEEFNNGTKFVMPLFNTLSYLEMEGQGFENIFINDTLKVKFQVPEGRKNFKLRFFTTGHGDDEFIPRQHTILLDGQQIFRTIPWRTDCGSFRENNPASGNFPNGMSSSDYSRSNWCPGIVVNPFEIVLEGIDNNIHEIMVVIPSGKNSYWNVSGCITGE